MNIKLPPIIQKYVAVSNQHDVKSILACFSDDAVVRDEGKEFRGKEMIEGWIVKTIEKYKFHFKPLSNKDDRDEMVVAVQVSERSMAARSRSIITLRSSETELDR
jgi:ketosteroid isomerase-like protein